jgi:predicted nucleotidyltransferase
MSTLLERVVQTIRERGDAIEAEYGVRLTGIVGSVARGEERPDSDIDLVFEVTGYTTLFRLGGLAADLQDLFGRPVDLVDPRGMRKSGWELMSRDLVLV